MRRTLPAVAAATLSLVFSADALTAGYATRTLEKGSTGSDVPSSSPGSHRFRSIGSRASARERSRSRHRAAAR